MFKNKFMPYERKTVDIHISSTMRDILIKMDKYSNAIARTLLRGRIAKELLVEDYVDFISVSTSDVTKISYLNQARISKIHPDEYWTSKNRYVARPGAFIKKLLANITDVEVEQFANLYRDIVNEKQFDLNIISGEEIRKWYYADSYKAHQSSLGNSCMKHSNCQPFFNIYIENPETIKMLIMTCPVDGRLIGRALLWNSDEHKVMDRIYTINDEEYAFHFKKWAAENGYLFKTEQKWNNSLWFGNKEEKFIKKLSFKLQNFKYPQYPYFDTFKFFDQDNGVVYNYKPEGINFVTTCAPDGRYFNSSHLELDGVTNYHHYYGDMVRLKYLDVKTFSGNVVWSEIHQTHIHTDHSFYNEDLSDYIFNDKMSQYNNKEEIDNQLNHIKKRKEDIANFRERIVDNFSNSQIEALFSIETPSTVETFDIVENNIVEHPQTDTANLVEVSSSHRSIEGGILRQRLDDAYVDPFWSAYIRRGSGDR